MRKSYKFAYDSKPQLGFYRSLVTGLEVSEVQTIY